ncbi:hypothetical protein [Clostridium arbusti]|uniref:hypothetical protein n=1 Tax=Clostridium arbusti TaxID=1137848 RepID=UPI00028906B1|nr:hypothetical protein [Clostridium arbusti]
MLKNTTYALWNKGQGSINSHGDYVTTDIFIKNIDLDKQPYNKELLLKTYGYDVDVTNRLFYEHYGVDEDIKINSILKTTDDTEEYEIRKFIRWDTYTEIFVYQIK